VLGGGNIFLSALLWTLRYVHPREAQEDSQQGKRWVDWVQKTLRSTITSSLGSGYAILIAAITQRKEISHYHAFFVFLLSDIVNRQLLTGPLGMMSDHEIQFLTIYYIGYQVLWIINIVTTIRRLDDWKDEPGKCFITFAGGTGGLFEKEDAIRWMWINLALNIWFQFVVPLGKWMGLFHIWRPPRKVARGILALYFVQAPSILLYIWNASWGFQVISANRHLVGKSERGWGFGQVGAVVALIGWVHTVVFSYLSKFSQSQSVLIVDSSRLEFKTKRHRRNIQSRAP